jgi:hypothetical protein
MLDVKILIEVFKEAVNKLLILINNLNFKDIIIINQSLTDNNSGLFSPAAFKLNRLEMGTFSIDVDYNEDSVVFILHLK